MTGAVITAARIRIAVAGIGLADDLLAAVTEVEVHQRLGRPAQLRITFAGQHLDAVDALVSTSAPVRCTIDGHDVELFRGTTTGAQRTWTSDGGERLVVRAADRLADAARERRHASFEDLDAIGVVRRIFEEHGLGLQSDRFVDREVVVHQIAESDLGVVRRLLAEHGLTLTLRGDTVHVVAPTGVGETLVLRPGIDLHELSIDRRLDPPVPSSVSGWDGATAGPAASGETNPLGGWTLDRTRAERLAAAHDQHDRADQVVADAVAVGDTRLRPGTPIALRSPVGPLRSGALTPHDLVLTTCTHRIDAPTGYTTRWSTQPIDPAPAPSPLTCTLGTVIAVDDPEGGARVRVALVAHGALPTDWMPVLCAGAGDGVGIVALPDVGASVVVLGPADAPGRGIVLGGLFGARDVPGPPTTDGRSTTFVARLAGGGQIAIHDHDSRLVIDNGNGSRVEMSPQAFTVHAATDLFLRAPGHRMVIGADTIDFERA